MCLLGGLEAVDARTTLGAMSDDGELRAAWSWAVGATAVSPAAEVAAALDELLGRLRDPKRRYHGLRHVTWVVRHVRSLAPSEHVTDLGAVVAAAFFHDAVYDPTAGDNEAQSAALAERVLRRLGWSDLRAGHVADLVLATQRHEATADPDRAVLVDADLAVLGGDPSAYQAYVTGVRMEYGHLSHEEWRRGRAAVLDELAGRDPLFATDAGRRRWQARARANIAAERASLSASVP